MIIAKSNVYLQQNLVNSTCASSRKRMKKFLEEQHGEARAEYGKRIINNLSKRLIVEYGGNKSFTPRDLRNYRKFYLIFKDFEIWYARVPNLNWTHYRSLIRVQNEDARKWYLMETSKEHWSTRTLDRNINSQY